MKSVCFAVSLLSVLVCAVLTRLQPVDGEAWPVVLEFAGGFHPLVLHLPIGLWFGLLFVLAFRSKFSSQDATRLLFWGTVLVFVSGLVAFGSGLLLYLAGGHVESAVRPHMYGALLFIAGTAGFGLLVRQGMRTPILWGWAVFVSLFLGITGHLGGVMTHGNLMDKAPWIVLKDHPAVDAVEAAAAPVPESMHGPLIFDAVVRPLLEEKCIFCHGARRGRGGLNMTSLETILAGGSDGPAVVNGSAADSLLVKRIDLPESDAKHMPPAGEPQLTAAETAFLRWWIGYGLEASMDELPEEHAELVDSIAEKSAE